MNLNTSKLTVGRLCALLQEMVEENFVDVLVEGEVSNCVTPASGHLYFTLKDSEAQLRAVMFRSQARLLPFRLENGQQVVCRGRVSIYRQRGEVQLLVERIEPTGLGGWQMALEQLKNKLAAEGLFAQERKRPLPVFPTTIGVVTSATGAAIRDILQILNRRAAGFRLLLTPVRVQGDSAPDEIVRGIEQLNRHGVAEVLIVGRGGGSQEDLWAFNDERVARAIASSTIPVISAVGHETDVTVADLVADLRAPTPSAAAELVIKNRLELEAHLDQLLIRLNRQLLGRLQLARERLDGLTARLRPPRDLIDRAAQSLQALESRLERSVSGLLADRQAELALACSRLEDLSPLATLARGYAVVRSGADAKPLLSTAGMAAGDPLLVRLSQGELDAVIERVRKE